jgi:hypothetical protein
LEIDMAALDAFHASALNITVRRLLVACVALLLLMAVLYVFASPAVDLDPTITRAWQLAFLLLCALAYLAKIIATAPRPLRLAECSSCRANAPPAVPLSPGRNLHCSWLC